MRQNQWKRVRDLRRLIKWNFTNGDSWITLTYRKDERPSWGEMIKHMRKFIRQLQAEYRKHGWALKYIWRPQVGRRGALHIHILINAMSTSKIRTEEIVRKLWPYGVPNGKVVYDLKNGDLANYIATPLQEWEPEEAKNYHPSRNLIRKEPVRETIRRRSLIDKDGRFREIKPKKGYYVDPNSIDQDINPVTGYAYRRYTLVKIQREEMKT